MMIPLSCIISFAKSINTEKSKLISSIASLLKANLKDLLDRSLIENNKF